MRLGTESRQARIPSHPSRVPRVDIRVVSALRTPYVVSGVRDEITTVAKDS